MAKLEDGLTVPEQVGYELRMRGHDLLHDAVLRRNQRDQSAGHIMRALGILLDSGGSLTAAELNAPDPVLLELEKARKALTAAVEIQRAKRNDELKRQHEEGRKVAAALELPEPPPYQAIEPSDPLTPVTVGELLSSIAKRYVILMLEWGDHVRQQPEEIASWLEVCRQLMFDRQLLGVFGNGDDHVHAWTAVIEPILQMDLKPRQKAERIVKACARQQGHDARNLIRE